jgi:hypothetical protein
VTGTAHEAPGAPPYGLMVKFDGKVAPLSFWSTSDSKALELVDEIPAPTVFKLERSSLPDTWYAYFAFPGRNAVGFASTRPEAICRAYIAAREWMATKAGA